MTEQPRSDLEQLNDYRWLATDEAKFRWNQLLENGGWDQSVPNSFPSQKLTPRRRELLVSQLEMQKSAKEKFLRPSDWYWTRKLLEQSSDEWCAKETALDIPEGLPVLDLCSGAGADAIAIASLGHSVTSFDTDPIACALLNANARNHAVHIDIHQAMAESALLSVDLFVHIDPDRRGGGARVTSIKDFLPSWPNIERMILQSAGVSIKVAPATRTAQGETDSPQVIRFISRNRSVRQQRWIWGQTRWPSHSLVVSSHHHQQWCHEVFDQHELLSQPLQRSSTELCDFLADYDAAIRAAGAAHMFAARLGCRLLSVNGYMTNAAPVVHPMARWFRVLDVMSMDRKKLVAFSRKTPVRAWELKTRGVEFPLDALRKQLSIDPDSNRTLTLLFTKIGDRNQTIIAEPCEAAR